LDRRAGVALAFRSATRETITFVIGPRQNVRGPIRLHREARETALRFTPNRT
jgi:hypothetical protein